MSHNNISVNSQLPTVTGAISLASTDLSDTADLARLASPAFTGTPSSTTATQGDNSTRIATTSYVDTAVAGVSGGAPAVSTDNSGTNTTISTSTGIEEIHLIDNGANNVVITIPVTSAGYKYQIKRLGAGTCSISPASGTIDTAGSFNLSSQFDSVTLVSDGTNYFVI